MIVKEHIRSGGHWYERRVRCDAVPRVGDRIDDGGQYWHEVIGVHWAHEGFFFPRLVPTVVLREHDRAEEAAERIEHSGA